MSFLAALSFLTIIPLPRRLEIKTEAIERSIVYFPLVGLIIGLMLVGLNWVLGLLLPTVLVNGLLIVALTVITGALHLDGFVDTCDGIGGIKTVEARWAAMRDSRTGAFGVIGVFLLLLIKYLSLSSVPQNLLMATLVLMPVIGRWAMVYAVFAHSYAKTAGLGNLFKQGANWQRFALATIIFLVIAIGLALLANVNYFYLASLAIIVGVWVIVIIMSTYFKRKFSGLTGDTYGAINEVAEVCVLIFISLLAHNRWLI
ncbi:MAG: adenosylcobinamide-GDP ribazoletransferase [Chloroflexota bacterium]